MAQALERDSVETKKPAADDVMPFEALQATLANGLRVIIVPTGFPNLASLQIPVQTGSRNEVEPGKSGFAHFFEHMMFRGTKRFPAEAYKDIITRTGARQNAYTSDDYTNYHVTFAAEDLETVLDIESDRFMNLDYSDEGFRTESRAVLGEYNKNSAEPLQKLFEVQRDRAFTTHTYKHTVMGFLADIEDMPNQFDYSRTFFDRWYRPEYTTVLLAGDVEPEHVLALVERYWGGWERGSFHVDIPTEPPPQDPVVAHVAWPTETLPWLTVAFHAPAFSETQRTFAALDVLLDLQFGDTSDVYRRLVEVEQKVDQLAVYNAPTADPSLVTIMARLKRLDDMAYVRDVLLNVVAQSRDVRVAEKRLEEAKAHTRYAFARTLDNSESIAGTLASFVRHRRSYDTLNQFFRRYAELTRDDLQGVAREYLTDDAMVITTLSHEPLPASMLEPARIPNGDTRADAGSLRNDIIVQRTPSPLVRIKLLFETGSAHDPRGKEGLSALAAQMIVNAGSEEMRVDEINRALFPIAASFRAQVDREMTAFTGVVHRDALDRFVEVALPQLLAPGLREDDFSRIKQRQMNALVQDLRANNDEELGKERLQANIFAGSTYGHPTLGTVFGIEAITSDDVRHFLSRAYTRSALTLGLAGDAPDAFVDELESRLSALPEGRNPSLPQIAPRRAKGLEVEIIEKDTRATAISFGHPIDVTRSHDDFAALWLARSWLGDHRAFHAQLFQQLRELRGLNYGDQEYIEALTRGMYQFFPDPNLARRSQIFEVWIRPVMPEHGVFALKAGLHEVEQMIERGLDDEQFDMTRNYLMKNVFVMTKTQDQQLGYALDSRWYGIGEFTAFMRERLQRLTKDDVNKAVRRHLSAKDVSVVMITKDASGLREALLTDDFTPIEYDSQKPPDLLADDKLIGARKLNILAEALRITRLDDVFAE